MTVIKIEFSPSAKLLALDTGQTWHRHKIAFTIPGSAQALVTLPDAWGEERISRFINLYSFELVDDGNGPPEHPLWRYEHTYGIMGFPDVGAMADAAAVSDTFKLHGVSDDVWKRGKGGEGTLIAIIDTGVDSRHAAFAGVEVIGDGKDRDGHGHGTHVASTAASSWGIASKARIYAGKGLEDDGNGSEAQIANLIRHAADSGAHVINLSLGGNPSQVMDDACNYAKAKGSIVVCAAGNAGSASIGSPARGADLIVMAHDRNRQWASFTQGRGWPNPNRVGFNGVGIQAAQANSLTGITSMSGTSMATPHAVGCAALLRAAGVTRTDTLAYLLGHRFIAVSPPDGPGGVLMALDFGEVVAPPPPPEPPTPEEWIHAIDLSYAEVSLAQAQALYAQGFRLAIQCLLAAPPGGFDQPRHRVTNLRNLSDAGFIVAGYLSLRPEASGGIAVDKAYTGMPADLWARLAFVAPDLEIPGLTLNHCLQALARLHGLGKHVEVIYTNYKSWHDDMGDPPGPSLSKLWNASWDNDPDIDFLRLPFGGWTLERLAGEQYQGGTVVHGVEVDLNVFRKSFLPGVPTPPPPPPPPPPVPGLVVAGIGVRFTDGSEKQLWP